MPYVVVKRPEGYEDNTWWHGYPITYAFGHPKVRMRLERLMGTNMVILNDRRYMKDLRESIQRDLVNQGNERIRVGREREEDRVMKLIMNGAIDMADAPLEYRSHPVYQTVMTTRKFIDKRRKKILNKRYKSIRMYSYKCPTWDMSELAEPRSFEPFAEMVERGSWTDYGENPRPELPPGYTDPMLVLLPEDVTENNYVLHNKDLYPYESQEIKNFHKVQTVDELYAYSDEFIGSLHTLEHNPLVKVKYHI